MVITTNEAAKRCDVSVQRIRQLIKELQIIPGRIGKAIVLSPGQMRRLEKRNTKRGRSKK